MAHTARRTSLTRFVLSTLIVALCLGFASRVQAGDKDPLFVSVTTDDDYRSGLALHLAKRMSDLGHPVTLFFNDRGIFVASKANAKKFEEQHALLAELAKAGATMIACPFCMKHYGIKEAELVEPIRVGNPQMIGEALFRDNTKTLAW